MHRLDPGALPRPANDGVVEPKARVLIVHGAITTARDLSRRLTALGYGVCGIARSATMAVRTAGWVRPDLVLMDVKPRGKGDGVQAAEAIGARYRIPSVFLVGRADPEIVRRALRSGPLGLIEEPYTPEGLARAMEEAQSRLSWRTEPRAAAQH